MTVSMSRYPPDKSSGMAGEQTIEHISRNCDECGRCLGECAFLQRRGTPGRIAGRYLAGSSELLPAAFSCSLCGLCEERCPKGLPMAGMFLELRRRAVREGRGRFKEHLPLLWFEALGGSPLLAGYFLPVGCTTVLFPGCALPGIRPRETYRLFRLLQKRMPKLGLVFDCCNKPSHDLGLENRFMGKISKKIRLMQDRGVKKVITACPSCLQIFRRYGEGLEAEAVYTRLTEYEFGRLDSSGLRYTLHDPCTVRFDPDIHLAVRQLTASMGLPLTEMEHSRATTFCCGEGGAAMCPDGGRDLGWRGKRLAEAGDQSLVTYCAGCTSSLASGCTYHLLDLLLSPERSDKAPKAVKPPFTYLNRWYLNLKMRMSLLLGR